MGEPMTHQEFVKKCEIIIIGYHALKLQKKLPYVNESLIDDYIEAGKYLGWKRVTELEELTELVGYREALERIIQ